MTGHDGASSPAGMRRFDPSAEIEWSPVWSLRDERFKHLPTGLLYFFHDASGTKFGADSNGCAAGNTLEEAILQGFLELVERDACAIWWYNRLQRAEIDLDRAWRQLHSGFASPVRRDGTPPVGAGCDQRSRHSGRHGRPALERRCAGTYRVRRGRAFRPPHRRTPGGDRAQPISGGRSDEAACRRPTAANRGDALPLPLRKNAYVLPHGKATTRGRAIAPNSQASIGASRSLAASSLPGGSASISSFSTRPGPTSTFPLSG